VKQAMSGSPTTVDTGEVLKLIVTAARKIHHGSSVTSFKRRTFFIWRALKYRTQLGEFWERLRRASPEGRLPVYVDVVGVIEWPYVNNCWTVTQRLDRIATHYELLASASRSLLALDKRTAVRLVDLSKFSGHCEILIDRPLWLKREGELVLNLFRDSLRVASMPFILTVEDGTPAIIIGGTQGIHRGMSTEESLQIFRELTKDFEGLRPRSLLIEILRMIANALQIKRLLAVADENRHHRHRYFGPDKQSKLAVNYNEIWTEHGGSASPVPGFYELPVHPMRKELTDIPAKKRAMYRRRYAMMTEIEGEIATTVKAWTQVNSVANVKRVPNV
jgi:uncharacterized protein VirK/YbjX